MSDTITDAIQRYHVIKDSYLKNHKEDTELIFHAMMLEATYRKGKALQAAHRAVTALAVVCLGLCFYILWKGC
jgi:hypothetical protein